LLTVLASSLSEIRFSPNMVHSFLQGATAQQRMTRDEGINHMACSWSVRADLPSNLIVRPADLHDAEIIRRTSNLVRKFAARPRQAARGQRPVPTSSGPHRLRRERGFAVRTVPRDTCRSRISAESDPPATAPAIAATRQ
jgi:hypothetical protein